MKRREFIVNTSMVSLAAFSPAMKAMAMGEGIKTAQDLQDYLRSLHKVGEPSVDRIVIGDPLTKIRKAGTCWQPYLSTLKQANEMGINLMVVHEPTFYTHWDLDLENDLFQSTPSAARNKYLDAIREKKQWIEKNKMVIIRSHDVPDIIKGFGIPFGLGQALGYDNQDIIRSRDYYNVYQIETDTAWNVAQKMASSLMTLNQPGVAFYGDKDRKVSSVGLGTGCICDPMAYEDLNADLRIAIDDVVRTWIQTTYAEDSGDPLVVINHGTSEELGMRLLSQHLTQHIPEIEFLHLNQGCTYRWIPGN